MTNIGRNYRVKDNTVCSCPGNCIVERVHNAVGMCSACLDGYHSLFRR
jgi:hypothetical protein